MHKHLLIKETSVFNPIFKISKNQHHYLIKLH